MDTLICGICADLPAKFSLYECPSCTEGSCSASTGQQPSHSACGSRALFPGAEGAPPIPMAQNLTFSDESYEHGMCLKKRINTIYQHI